MIKILEWILIAGLWIGTLALGYFIGHGEGYEKGINNSKIEVVE